MRILITGCSTGFGRTAATELTARGHEVVATARKVEVIDDPTSRSDSRSTLMTMFRYGRRSQPLVRWTRW